jgi:signal transduction histidine kinase
LAPRVAVAGQEYFCQGVALQSDVGANRVLYFFYPEARLREAVMQAIQPALIIGAIGGTIALALTLLMTQRITRRLRELVRRTRLIADGDFSPMPLGERRDELQELGQAVNEMAGRLAKSEDVLRSSERLRLLGQVSGGLAHQLRNGVAGAKLAVQLHARATPGIEELDVALRQLSLVEIQLKRFLDLGKATELNRQVCNLGTVVEESVALLRPSCVHTRIALHWQPPTEPVSLSADAHQLGQVVLNLLTNAIEAAGPGGWIEVKVGLARTVAFVEVNDSGAGLDPKVVNRLFEPFVTSKPEGVGLGLAVARQIVQAHGGTIAWARRGDATCFRIELPR